MLCTPHHSGDQVKETEMGRTCGAYGGEDKCILGFSGEGDYFEDPGVDGRIILNWILRGWMGARTGSIWLRIGTVGGLL
jgi:hypothetical protein